MKLDDLCNQVYVVALNEAKMQSHEYVTPEHYLYSALMFDVGKGILERSGGNINGIKDELTGFFDTKIQRGMTDNPSDSLGFVQMFELASAQVFTSGKSIIRLGNIIAAIFNLRESFAAYIMQKNGVSRLALLKVISHEAGYEEKDNVKSAEGEFLRQYAVNLTERAERGMLDPLIGREEVLERTIQILSRRLKNNPVHVGDPGVGKTAIVEGLAARIAEQRVPKSLRGSNIFYIDMGTIVAGTKYRGDFEERLIKLIEMISKEIKPIIYIDEIHTVVGAGAVSGGGLDATSILKPYLARGEIRFIGSTTHEEYKKYFEKDRALSRRFQRIDVSEPTYDECVKILTGLKPHYEEYHNVIYTDESISHICKLTSKYIMDRYLPDKAIDVMDETGAYLRTRDDRGLRKVVTTRDIERTVASMAKIPENSVASDELAKLANLDKRLNEQVFGQDEAIEAVTNAIQASRAGLNDPDKPVASLLFVGPSGVGKTEIARQLAACMNIKLERFDMSEYQEKHSVARLIGSPPGYVGYEEGGLLTEAIRKTPYCCLLLDEIEKAHPDIYNLLLQIMDYGSLTDNTGKKADFRNTVLIMTSNAGAKEMGKRLIGFDEDLAGVGVVSRELEKIFSPEFRNRLDAIITFNSLDMEMAVKIAKKAINRLQERLKGRGIALQCTDSAYRHIAERGISDIYGAREIIRLVDRDIKKKLVGSLLFESIQNEATVFIDVADGKLTVTTQAVKQEIEDDAKSV